LAAGRAATVSGSADAPVLPDGVTSLPDGAAAGAEAAMPADASYATETAVSPDMPVAASEVAASSADASLDMAGAPLDVPASPDSLTDAVAEDRAEVPGIPDAAGFEAAKPDAVTIDIAATDLAPAALGEISAQQLHTAWPTRTSCSSMSTTPTPEASRAPTRASPTTTYLPWLPSSAPISIPRSC